MTDGANDSRLIQARSCRSSGGQPTSPQRVKLSPMVARDPPDRARRIDGAQPALERGVEHLVVRVARRVGRAAGREERERLVVANPRDDRGWFQQVGATSAICRHARSRKPGFVASPAS